VLLLQQMLMKESSENPYTMQSALNQIALESSGEIYGLVTESWDRPRVSVF
jgi:hypothetical protein